ncbi:hypothetical protein AC1031_019745 [Aphanomyces cochlioides]|nr:hypothetical protein AC1031_019745 [Aphanomyces cochlioides]
MARHPNKLRSPRQALTSTSSILYIQTYLSQTGLRSKERQNEGSMWAKFVQSYVSQYFRETIAKLTQFSASIMPRRHLCSCLEQVQVIGNHSERWVHALIPVTRYLPHSAGLTTPKHVLELRGQHGLED